MRISIQNYMRLYICTSAITKFELINVWDYSAWLSITASVINKNIKTRLNCIKIWRFWRCKWSTSRAISCCGSDIWYTCIDAPLWTPLHPNDTQHPRRGSPPKQFPQFVTHGRRHPITASLGKDSRTQRHPVAVLCSMCCILHCNVLHSALQCFAFCSGCFTPALCATICCHIIMLAW